MAKFCGNSLLLLTPSLLPKEGDIVIVFYGSLSDTAVIRRMGIYKDENTVYERQPVPIIIDGISYHNRKISYQEFHQGYPIYKILTTTEEQNHEYFTLPTYVLNEYITVPKRRKNTFMYQNVTCLHPRMVIFRAEQGLKDTTPYQPGKSSCDTYAFECKTDNDVTPLLAEQTETIRDPSAIKESYCILM